MYHGTRIVASTIRDVPVSSDSHEMPLSPGIITYYELWMRGAQRPDGSRDPSEQRLFHPSGAYSPRPTLAPQENALEPPATNYAVTGLGRFTEYEFQVLSQNALGKAASEWVVGRTSEDSELRIH